MKKTLYLGMRNEPHEVWETAHVKNGKVVYQYEDNNGRRVMLRATGDACAYYPPHDYTRSRNWMLPPCIEGELYPVNILDKGYDVHHFELVAL